MGGCGTPLLPLGAGISPLLVADVGATEESDVLGAELDVRRLDDFAGRDEMFPLVSPSVPACVVGSADVTSAPPFSEGRFGISMTLICFSCAFCSGSEPKPTRMPAAPQATTTAITTATTLQRDFFRDSS